MELRRTPDHLLVSLVRAGRLDLDDDRLLHRVRDDDSTPLLTAAAFVLRLLESDDRLARRRALTLSLCPRRARAPGHVLLTAPAGRARRGFRGRLFCGGLRGGGLRGWRFCSRRLL